MRACIDVANLIGVIGEKDSTSTRLTMGVEDPQSIQSTQSRLQIIWTTFTCALGLVPEDEPHVYHLIILHLLTEWPKLPLPFLADDLGLQVPWDQIVKTVNLAPLPYRSRIGADVSIGSIERPYLPLDDLLAGFAWTSDTKISPTSKESIMFDAEYLANAMGNLGDRLADDKLVEPVSFSSGQKKAPRKSDRAEHRSRQKSVPSSHEVESEELYRDNAWTRFCQLAQKLVQSTDGLEWDVELSEVIMTGSLAAKVDASTPDQPTGTSSVEDTQDVSMAVKDSHKEKVEVCCSRTSKIGISLYCSDATTRMVHSYGALVRNTW